jgi:8-oxo-dGTP pyrophosphatase MutT (NUDIX family)
MHVFLTGTFESGQHQIIDQIVLTQPELQVYVCPASCNGDRFLPQIRRLLEGTAPVLGSISSGSSLLLDNLGRNPNVLLLEVTSKNQERTRKAVEEALFSTEEQMDPSRSCGAVVVRSYGKQWETLLIRTKRGNWSFPKGRMNPGETEPMTAAREIREETGISTMIDLCFRKEVPSIPVNRAGLSNNRSIVFYLAKAICGEAHPQLSEICELKWVLLSKEASTLIEYPPDRQVFLDALDALGSAGAN